MLFTEGGNHQLTRGSLGTESRSQGVVVHLIRKHVLLVQGAIGQSGNRVALIELGKEHDDRLAEVSVLGDRPVQGNVFGFVAEVLGQRITFRSRDAFGLGLMVLLFVPATHVVPSVGVVVPRSGARRLRRPKAVADFARIDPELRRDGANIDPDAQSLFT
jgi:hypothetical protein